MNRFFFLVLAAIGLLGLQGCGQQCKQAQEQIIKPATAVIDYLNTAPTGEELQQTGCPMILKSFDDIPEASDMVRKTADLKFTHTDSHCLRWATGVRYNCYGSFTSMHISSRRPGGPDRHRPSRPSHPPRHPGYHPIRDCYPETYTYCAEWQHDVIRDPGYETAIRLSQELDLMYAQAHSLCGLAASGRYTEASGKAQDLLAYMISTVRPDGERIYALAGCPKIK